MDEKIKAARQQLGRFFQERREEMGFDRKALAIFVGISAETIKGIETGRFAWDIDMHLRICQALEIKPYFSVTKNPVEEDWYARRENDPDRYHGFYFAENILLWPDQVAIIKLTSPRLFVRFNYPDSYFSSYKDWKANHTQVEWLDPNDKPTNPEEIEGHLTDCWNFLALHEREEERLADENDDYENEEKKSWRQKKRGR